MITTWIENLARAETNGHRLKKPFAIHVGGRPSLLTRCTSPGCGASVWELPDLSGNYGAGPRIRCSTRMERDDRYNH